MQRRCITLARIYVSFNNQAEVIELPILPEELEINEKSDNKNHVLQNIGEITIINTCKEPTLKLEGVFPAEDSPHVTSEILKDPVDYIDALKRWRDSNKPMRLVVTGLAFDVNWPCTIESLSYREEGGAVGDIYYSIEFKEYRWYKVKKVEVVTQTTQGSTQKVETAKVTPSRPVTKETPKTYTVKSGDTLSAICKKQLGNASKYPEIAKKNNIKNPNLIYPGQVLKL